MPVSDINELDQPVGHLVPGWTARTRPAARPMTGRLCRVEPLEPVRHADDLYRANCADEKGRMWTYLPYGPFDSLTSYRAWLQGVAGREDPMFFAIIDGQGRAVGVASFLRIDPSAGTIEVGHLAFSPAVQATTAATEAMVLMMRTVFDELGYRRYEWKCDSLNTASRRAAQRLGAACWRSHLDSSAYDDRRATIVVRRPPRWPDTSLHKGRAVHPMPA